MQSNFWKQELDDLNVKILTCKRRNSISAFISGKMFEITFKYKNKLYKLNTWGGTGLSENAEDIRFAIYNSIENMDKEDICKEVLK